jgi:hypothetical protein
LETVTEGEQGVVGGNQGSFALLGVGSFALLSYTNQCPSERPFYCKGNLTVLRRVLYLDLAKGNPKLIYQWDWLMYNTCLAKGNPKRTL